MTLLQSCWRSKSQPYCPLDHHRSWKLRFYHSLLSKLQGVFFNWCPPKNHKFFSVSKFWHLELFWLDLLCNLTLRTFRGVPVKKNTLYQTSESMSVASLELTITIIKQVLLHFMIILLNMSFFNFKVWELYIRGNFPAPIETWLLHSRGSPLSIRDVSPNWTTYLFWSLFTPQAPALCSPMAMVTRIKDQDWICCVRWGKNCCCSGNRQEWSTVSGGWRSWWHCFCPALSCLLNHQEGVVERKGQGSGN